MSDLLAAHGYKNDGQLSVDDVRSLLPAILYSVENPGCARQSPPSQSYSFTDGKQSFESRADECSFF